MNRPTSSKLFARAKDLMPGGVNSPVRAFRGVGGDPVFFQNGKAAWLTDVDGNRYVDYVGSWGPLILGHAHPAILDAVSKAMANGTSYGAPHPGELELAELIIKAVPSVQKLRLVSSGTEATTAAVRLARGATGRDSIIKFEGCYHGAGDSFLVKAGSGVETLGLPDSPGVPSALAQLTLTSAFNDLPALEQLLDAHKGKVAAIILEPVVGNMGLLPPKPGFLKGVRELCTEHGALLIFDEVMTGFRLALGGAQQLYGVSADLTTMGKVIGGGLPVGAYGGRAELMDHIAPAGPIYQAGTLSGNPLAVAAGAACLRELLKPGQFDKLEATSKAIADGIGQLAKDAGMELVVGRVGSMFTVFFCKDAPFDYASAKKADSKKFGRFFHALLDAGVYFPPSQFEAAFVSLAHTESDVTHTLTGVKKALEQVAA